MQLIISPAGRGAAAVLALRCLLWLCVHLQGPEWCEPLGLLKQPGGVSG